MADLFAVTGFPLPTRLHGADGDYSIRPLSNRERLAIEDYLSKKDVKSSLSKETTAVVVPQSQTVKLASEDFAILIEFALGILSVSGFQPVAMIATLNASTCLDVLQRQADQGVGGAPTFPKKLTKAAASTWMRRLFQARHGTKDNLHITADRFVRYLKASDTRDSLVDLCICLESLIAAQTEISFRFAMCLAKVAGLEDRQGVSDLLEDLYDLRSKVVHGADPTRAHAKIAANTVRLRLVARAIITAHILYMTDHTKDEWQRHLRHSLLV